MPSTLQANQFPTFDESLKGSGHFPLKADGISIFQINLGKACNQACKHCHVEAGPNRTEKMSAETMKLCLEALEKTDIPVVDITGGAPEMHPLYRELVEKCRAMDKTVITRCNLTILMEKGYEDFIEFYKDNGVVVVASLPYYKKEETDAMRGNGAFDKSIEALKKLNEAGFGQPDSGLLLNLVYNPAGAFLPPSQSSLELDFKRELEKRHSVVFNSLFTMINMPVARFLDYLKRSKNYDPYIKKLVGAYNASAATSLMCRSTLSISWDGYLYDCDFNQMLDIRVNHGAPSHMDDWDFAKLSEREITTGLHCYGCTAGSGSSCGGEIS